MAILADVRTEVNLSQASAQIQRALRDGRAGMYRAATAVSLTPQGTPARVGDLLTAWAGAVRQVRADVNASNAVKNEAERVLRDDARQTLADLRREFATALDAYRQKLADKTPALPADQHLILWARVERQLTAGVRPQEVAADADEQTLSVMAQELKSWRRAQTPADRGLADQLAAADLEAINQRRYEIGTPAQRKDLDAAKATETGAYRVDVCFAQAENVISFLDDFITGEVRRQVFLPNWGDGETLLTL